eukprot:SAG31_NODE_3031_length_4765_cov_2.047364_5_plen_71_part_00
MRPRGHHPQHEFALLGLQADVCCTVPFTSSASVFAEAIDGLVTSTDAVAAVAAFERCGELCQAATRRTWD